MAPRDARTRSVRWLALAAVLAACLSLLGCGDGSPYCGLPADITDRLAVYCDDPRSDPVCDYPGETAGFEDTASGLRLVGGEFAACNFDDEVECPPGTVGEPYCIVDPEL